MATRNGSRRHRNLPPPTRLNLAWQSKTRSIASGTSSNASVSACSRPARPRVKRDQARAGFVARRRAKPKRKNWTAALRLRPQMDSSSPMSISRMNPGAGRPPSYSARMKRAGSRRTSPSCRFRKSWTRCGFILLSPNPPINPAWSQTAGDTFGPPPFHILEPRYSPSSGSVANDNWTPREPPMPVHG
jgi:hypothetical protein